MLLKSLSPRVFLIPEFLTVPECRDLVVLADQSGFESAGVRTADGQQSMPRVRNNERTMVASPVWVERLWHRLGSVELPELDGARAVGLPKDLRFYRYQPGQRFKMHKDGPWHELGLTSKPTFLVYLNDNFAGGATDFRDFQVEPVTGSALMFIHDTWHEGAVVTEGTKYVLRSDVLFR